MNMFMKLFLALGFLLSALHITPVVLADDSDAEETQATEDQSGETEERKEVCAVAKATSKNKNASDEERAEAKKVHKACKKEKRKRNSKNCIPTSTRIARC